jgi:nucleoside-diphosphate-sugar epimerase
MRILFLGGSYFVGRTIVARLVADGHDVTLLNRGSRPVAGTRQLIADRDDTDAIRQVLAGREFDWVVDTLTASTHHVDAFCDALGSRLSGWLYISSAAVYAEDGSYPMPESHPVGTSRQWGDYGLSKLAPEQRLAQRCCAVEVPFVSLRPPYIYGRDNPAPREHWLWARLRAGRPVLVPDAGDTPIQFLHAADLGRAVAHTLERSDLSGTHIYNVGEPGWVSLREYLEILARVSRMSLDVRPVPYRSLGIEPRDFFPFRDYPCVLDTAKIEREMRWKPQTSLEPGLALTFEQTEATRYDIELDTAVEDRILARL